jgi:hypothetical protein
MDDLREIIQTLDDDDKKEFRHFLNRVKQKGNRKDTALFEILQEEKEYKSKEVLGKLYTGNNKEAYYALRKRLNEQLNNFVVLKSRLKDSTSISTVMEFVNLSQYLYDQKRNRLAIKYLEKARKLAEEIEHYELLNGIYNLLFDKKEWESESDLNEMIVLQKANKLKLEQDERINLANSIIKYKLIQNQKETKALDFNKLTNKVFKDFGLNNDVLVSPKVLHKLMSLSRSSIIAKKDFHSFEPFVINKYNELLKKGAFTDKVVFYRMGLLYFIAHTLYRNKKFVEAKHYLNEFKSCLDGEGQSYFVFYSPRYMQLTAAVSVFSNDLANAQSCLDELLENKRLNLEHSDRLNILINKGINHFLNNDLESSHKVLLSIYHTDKWCEKAMGKEWVLKKNLMEVILYYDMGKIEVAESRLRSIERTYSDLFRHPVYKGVKGFLSLIKFVIMNPHEARSEKFQNVVEEAIDWKPFEQEDIQAMGFYAWLKSKMQNRPVYEVWLELALVSVE